MPRPFQRIDTGTHAKEVFRIRSNFFLARPTEYVGSMGTPDMKSALWTFNATNLVGVDRSHVPLGR